MVIDEVYAEKVLVLDESPTLLETLGSDDPHIPVANL
jgi:hypothetical protein